MARSVGANHRTRDAAYWSTRIPQGVPYYRVRSRGSQEVRHVGRGHEVLDGHLTRAWRVTGAMLGVSREVSGESHASWNRLPNARSGLDGPRGTCLLRLR